MGSLCSKLRKRRSEVEPPDPSELMDKSVAMATENLSKTEKMSDKVVLLNTLEDLGLEEFNKFKWFLQQPENLGTSRAIPKNQLENTNRLETVDKIIQTFGHQSVEVVKKVLKKIPRNDLVEKLSNTSPGEQEHSPKKLETTVEVLPRTQSEACSPHNTLLEAPLSLQTPTPPQTTSPSAPTLPGPSKPTTLLLNPPVDKTQNTSSKYDNIACKVLIQSGSPAVYQLKPKKEKIGPLTRMTLGEKDPNKNNKTILLVGETGSGKSTLINALVNYAMGVEWEDNIWFKIVEEEKRSQSESQTSDVMVYQIFGFEGKTLPYSLTIIDTPGYGDTSGIEHDVNISQRLIDLFRSEDGVHEINAVGLVMKGSVNRLSDRLRYIFDSVVSLFGKNIEKNIVALITHSDGRTPKNALEALEAAKIKCARNEKNQPVHFLFNNCLGEDTTENMRALKYAHEITTEGMSQFTNFVSKTAPQKMQKTVHVLNGRIRLTACINNLQERIELIDLKKAEIQQTQAGLKKHEEEMKKNEKFTIEVDEPYKEKEPIDGGMWGLVLSEGAVCCTVCEENCHYPGCTMARKPGHCEVMEDGRCTVCTRKCPASDHVKEEWKYVTKTRKVKKTLEDVKEKYEMNKEENEKLERLLETLQKEKETLEANKTPLLDEAYLHVVKLEQIALNDVSLSTHVHLDFLIKEMEKKNDTEKVNHLKLMASRKDEGVQAGLRYMYNAVPQMNKKKEN